MVKSVKPAGKAPTRKENSKSTFRAVRTISVNTLKSYQKKHYSERQYLKEKGHILKVSMNNKAKIP